MLVDDLPNYRLGDVERVGMCRICKGVVVLHEDSTLQCYCGEFWAWQGTWDALDSFLW